MWYRTGTISLTNGSTAVTGSGTAWIANAGVGEAIYGPDGRLYEIAAIVSNTSITLASNYLGTTQTGQSYVIVPSQSYIRDLANQAAELINSYAETQATVGQGKYTDGSSSSPSISFVSETNTGFYKSATNEVTYVSNGIAQFKYNLSGLTILTGLTLPTSASPSQTAEGSIVWNSTNDLLTVGTGAGRKTMVDTDSTQTLTNKTLTSPNLSNPSISGTIAGASLTLSGNTTVGDASTDVMIVNAVATYNAPTIVNVNTSTDALRITQTGSGNALVVEDSNNPDSTPFVIDSAGFITQGSTTRIQPAGINPLIQTNSTGSTVIANLGWSTISAAPPSYSTFRSASGTIGTQGAVSSGFDLGAFNFYGDDGTAFIQAAQILAEVDGTPGTNDMPGRLVFSTTADGASTPTERMRIDSAGQIGIGGAAAGGRKVDITGTLPAASGFSIPYSLRGTISSNATTAVYGFYSTPTTEATAFTLPSLSHFFANPAAFGAGSTVTNQYGFHAGTSLTGATNNYGFYSNIASGTGRYNFYAAGSADNYFAGNVGIGSTNLTGYTLRVSNALTGSVNVQAVFANGSVQSDVTSNAWYFRTSINTAASAFTLTNLYHIAASQNIIGAGSAVTNQFGHHVDSSLTGATNNYGFYSNIASSTGRYNFYAAGSAPNYFAGAVTIVGALTVTDPVVQQSDIGTAPNEVPVNGMLGALAFTDTVMTSVPASATAAGTKGQIAEDGSYLYICTAANTWKRVAIATW